LVAIEEVAEKFVLGLGEADSSAALRNDKQKKHAMSIR